MIDLCQRCRNKNHIYLGQAIYLPMRVPLDYSKIVALRGKGKDVNEIAQKFGITSRRVLQILAKTKRVRS